MENVNDREREQKRWVGGETKKEIADIESWDTSLHCWVPLFNKGVKIMMITGELVCCHISWRSCYQWCYEREDCYRTGSRAIEPNLPDDHPVLLQLRLHQGDQVAQFHLITTMMMMSTMIMVRSMMMMKTSSVGKLPLPWMGTTSFISSLNRDTLKSSYVLYCCRLMLTMMKWVIMFFRIMTMIMRIKPVHMIGLRTSGPAKERECLVFYYWDKSKFSIQTNQVHKFIICMFLSNKK